ncbi:MAG: DoxX family membrane protein [Planctomycetia bacterium]|nr:DoxX family membrane protein [Planctomycetia bacterium]
MAIVLLRIAIGCHFLYEGVWKVSNADTFSADPYLSEAKGLAAPLFYAMLDDFYGRDRLVVRYPEAVADENGVVPPPLSDLAVVESPRTVDDWRQFGEMLKRRIGPAKEQAAEPFSLEKLDAERAALVQEGNDQKASETPDQVRIAQITNRIAIIDSWKSLTAEKEKSAQTKADIEANLNIPATARQGQLQSLARRLVWIDEQLDWLSRQQRVAELEKLVAEGKADESQRQEAIVLGRRQWVDQQVSHYIASLQDYLDSNATEIAAHFLSLDRHLATLSQRGPAGTFGTDFEKKQSWDRKNELLAADDVWLRQLEVYTSSLKKTCFTQFDAWDAQTKSLVEAKVLKPGAVRELLSQGERIEGEVIPGNWWNPLTWTRSDQMSFLVTWVLTLIGLALIAGCCTRLASIGGAIFMGMIVLTQFSWPEWYPPNPGVVGHAMIIDKNFVEMMALLVLAAVGAGRWGGVDSAVWKIWMMLPCNRAKVAETKAS